jgi:hypothetical protein
MSQENPKQKTPNGKDPSEEHTHPRRSVRHKIRLKVDVQTTHSFHAWTHNVSTEGLCFEIPDKIQNGREITLWFLVDSDGQGPPIQARCRVVWRDSTQKGTRHGGQFLFFAEDGKQRLDEWLQSL